MLFRSGVTGSRGRFRIYSEISGEGSTPLGGTTNRELAESGLRQRVANSSGESPMGSNPILATDARNKWIIHGPANIDPLGIGS